MVSFVWHDFETVFVDTLRLVRDQDRTTLHDYPKIHYDPIRAVASTPYRQELWFNIMFDHVLDDILPVSGFLITPPEADHSFGENDTVYNVCHPRFRRAMKNIMHALK